MNVKTYLFDFDDTLIDTKIYAEIYQPILEMIETKLNLDPLQKAQQLGLTKNKFARYDTGDLCAELGLLEEYYQILEENIHIKNYLHDNIINIFTELKKRNKTIAIISNSMKRTIKLYLKKYELNKFIDFIFSIDDSEQKKDTDDFWEKLIKTHNLVPEECLVVGDDENDDVKTPQQFNFNTLLIKTPRDLQKCLN